MTLSELLAEHVDREATTDLDESLTTLDEAVLLTEALEDMEFEAGNGVFSTESDPNIDREMRFTQDHTRGMSDEELNNFHPDLVAARQEAGVNTVEFLTGASS